MCIKLLGEHALPDTVSVKPGGSELAKKVTNIDADVMHAQLTVSLTAVSSRINYNLEKQLRENGTVPLKHEGNVRLKAKL